MYIYICSVLFWFGCVLFNFLIGSSTSGLIVGSNWLTMGFILVYYYY